MQKNNSKNPIINLTKFVILPISIICIIGAGIIFFKWILDNKTSGDISEDIAEIAETTEIADDDNTQIINPPNESQGDYWDFIKMPLISVNFEELLKRNKDTVGWININNTNINYPVVQTSNNKDYLQTAFDGSNNRAGWIFADYRNNMKNFDKNTIIYGHSRVNGTMFGSLYNVLNKEWYNNKYNQVIRFSTPTENTMWQVFSVYKIEPESYYLTTSFKNNDSYLQFLNTIKNRSIYNFNVDLNETDKVITLSTCSDIAGTGRIVLHAKLIKRQSA